MAARLIARRAVRGRRLLLESLEERSLLATFALAGTADLYGSASYAARYGYVSGAAETQQGSQDFFAGQAPNEVSLGMSNTASANYFGDVAAGSISSNVGPQGVSLTASGHVGAVVVQAAPANLFVDRTSRQSFSISGSQYTIKIAPSSGESIGDLVGVNIHALVTGAAGGTDINSAPQGVTVVWGGYSYSYRVTAPNGATLGSHTASGSITPRLGDQSPLDEAVDGPLNVPIGGQIEITLQLAGDVATNDLRGSGQLNAALTLDVAFAAADLVAGSLGWSVRNSTDQAARKLDFTYVVNPEHDALHANAEIGFYWAAGASRQDILGGLDQPAYRYVIDQAYQKTEGVHAASAPLAELAAPPVGATHLVMVVDPLERVADANRANNVIAAAALADVQATGLTWDTRRDQDPYGGWRGVDARYAVQAAPASVAIDAAFYWSSTPDLSGKIGGAMTPHGLNLDFGLQQFNEPALWGTPPAGAAYALFVIDPADQVAQWDERHNVAALRVHSATEILRGALNLNPLDAAYDGSSPDMNARFSPGGGSYTISEAEVALGVQHFNWLQEVYSAPTHWSLYQDYGDGGVIALPWLDPSRDVPDQKYLILRSALTNSEERFADNPNDGEILYYNEPGFDHATQMTVEGATTSSYLKFFDSPRVPANFIIGPAESWRFVCSLEGVDEAGRLVPLPLSEERTFTWRSNAVYNAQDPAHPVAGGGVFLQLLDPSRAPPTTSGGVDQVQMLALESPVAVDDTARTEVETPVAVRTLMNDSDPQNAALAIASVTQPEHGAVRINDAGTPGDSTDDWIDYTPAAGFTGVDAFVYQLTRADGAGGSSAARVTVTVVPPIAALGVAGDALSSEYAAQGISDASSWVELLAAVRGVSLGATGEWDSPRDAGYQYDWAQFGATASSLVSAQQQVGLAAQIRAGEVSHAVLMIGANDFLPGASAYEGIYRQGLSQGWTNEQIQLYVNGVVNNIETALAALRRENVPVALGNLFDYSLTPNAVSRYPSALRRDLVSNVVTMVNQRLAAVAAAHHIPLLDVAGLMRSLLGTNQQLTESLTVGGVEFAASSGQDSLELYLADGLHPGTILNGFLANLVLEGFRQGYGVHTTSLSERELLEAAGVRYGGADTLEIDYAQFVILTANQPPTATANMYVVSQAHALVLTAAAGLLANDSDAEGDPLRAQLVGGGPAHGSLALHPDGSFTYQPLADFTGRDSFQYQVSDGRDASAPVTVTIYVSVAADLADAFTPGAYSPDASVFYLRNTNSMGNADVAFAFGAAGAGWIPLQGDWNGTLAYGVGLYDPAASLFYLTSQLSTGSAEISFGFGASGAGWIPLSGDFNGDGQTTVGLFDPATSRFYLRNSHSTGVADVTVAYGAAGANWIPVMGDWDGDGAATVGLYDPAASLFYLRNGNSTGMADATFGFGAAGEGWIPVVGDWNGDGRQSVGLFDPATSFYYLINEHAAGMADYVIGFGAPGSNWKPLSGDWDGSRASALQAAGAASAVAATEPLSAGAIVATMNAALDRWAAAGASAEQLAQLARLQITIADLSGDALGRAFGHQVVLDRDAAGFGWFVDPTPFADEEFGAGSGRALDARAVDRIDLLSVVAHEMGHVLGLDDLDASLADVMSGVLAAGLRRLP